MLRVGIVGAGQIAQEHLRVWNDLPNTTVTAVCDVNLSAAQALASKVGATPYNNVQAFLTATSVDLVDICTPPPTHAELSILGDAIGARRAGRKADGSDP